jgi:hypothetical protein
MSQPTASISDLEIAKLLDDLSSPDPATRDGESLGRLCELVDSGALSKAQVGLLGSQLIGRLSHAHVEARSFAALVLARIVLTGVSEPGWFPQFAAWYATENEVTGYDSDLGWLHAVAHGADALGAFGWTWPESPRPALDLAANRLLNPSPIVWRDQEDDRLGFAIAVALSNPHLTQHDAIAWMEPLKQAFVGGEPGPLPAFASNSIRTLRVVCLLVSVRMQYEGHDIRIQHSAAVERRLREVLHSVSPWMWSLEF